MEADGDGLHDDRIVPSFYPGFTRSLLFRLLLLNQADSELAAAAALQCIAHVYI